VRSTLGAAGLAPTLLEDGASVAEVLRAAEAEGAPFALAVANCHARVEPAVFNGLPLIGLRPPGGRKEECRGARFLTEPVLDSDLLEAVAELLPERPAPQLSAPAAAPARAAGRSLRILLAEDNAVNQTLAVRLLERRGHRVRTAVNGHQALAALAEEAFDLVLMDVQMPEMDGFETTARIRAGEKAPDRRLPIVALTAHAMKGYEERCLAAGMDAYLSKPIRADALYETIERLVSEAAPRPR
jgi:CheY-like chemotaxis protein